ncbi:MAG: hypothetical protein IJ571_01340 [Ruminococcus sp.]|nr:hypothetical protein [Ruminococcus sp.]
MGYNVSKDDENIQTDELVEMIDKLIASGSGHLTVSLDENADGIRVNRYNSTDCGAGQAACAQPNEKAIDETEDK